MKKYFNLSIYIEALRQTRVIGIVFTVISVVISAMLPIINIIEHYTTITSNYGFSHMYRPPISSTVQFVPVLMTLVSIVPIIIVINQFYFQNKRKSCDYYHSLPIKRTALFCNMLAASLTWILVMIITTILITAFLFIISPADTFSNILILTTLIQCTLTALGTAAATAIAVSITGTLFSNIVVTLLIIYFPHLISLVFSVILNSNLVIAGDYFSFFEVWDTNIILNAILSKFSWISYNELLFTIIRNLNDLFWAVACIILALILFNKRKSEAAGKSAVNNIFQHIYRCCITIPLTLVIPCMVFSGIADFSASIWFIIVIVVSLLIYYIYELITTKKLMNLLKATPFIFCIVLFDILFGLALFTSKQMILNDIPKPEQISAVSLISYNEQNSYYNSQKTTGIEIKNGRVNEIVSNRLSETVKLIKEDEYHNRYMKGYYDEYVDNNYTDITVKIIKTNSMSIQRQVSISIEELQEILHALEETPGFWEVMCTLPADNTINYIYLNSTYQSELGFITSIDENSKTKEIWDVFKEEWQTLTTADKLEILDIKQEYKSIATVNVSGNLTRKGTYTASFQNCYYITTKMPKTFEHIADSLKDDKIETFDTIMKLINDDLVETFSLELNSQESDFYIAEKFSQKSEGYNSNENFIEMIKLVGESLKNPVITDDSCIFNVWLLTHSVYGTPETLECKVYLNNQQIEELNRLKDGLYAYYA